MTQEQLNQYYERIGFTPVGGPSAENFKQIHIHHATHIPFENMEVYCGRPIVLDPEVLFNKMVVRKRGGYCFEMNGLLAEVLKTAGYTVKRVVARLDGMGKGFGGHLHCAAIVDMDGERYISDVGYGGGGFVEPVKLEYGVRQDVIGGAYRVVEDPRHGIVVQWMQNGEFKGYLAIRDDEALPMDFEIGSFYTSSHPTSGFKRFVMCNLPTLTGRISITADHVKIVENGEETLNKPLSGFEEVKAALKEYMGLDIDA